MPDVRRLTMRSLAFRSNGSCGLSFEWLLDGQSLPGLLGVPEDDRYMPYWVWLHGLPRGASIDEDNDGRILIAACSCGEPGCGRTTASITDEGDHLGLSAFISDSLEAQTELVFTVLATEFHACLTAIADAARTYHERSASERGTT